MFFKCVWIFAVRVIVSALDTHVCVCVCVCLCAFMCVCGAWQVLGQGCRALRTLDLSGLVFLTDGMKRDFAREGLQVRAYLRANS